ncbi:hypothetical protein AB5I39_08720 [Sphingomonas sp. MMS24-J45]|uniref:hypothetical protein n=1 Tax=Sphingomonas sp. MMS24-J45 TaxID=3238806 RepID=UPI00384E42DA
MAILSPKGRIDMECVEAEIGCLKRLWSGQRDDGVAVLAEVFATETLVEIDTFDRVQLADAIRVCRTSRSLSKAGACSSQPHAPDGHRQTQPVDCASISRGSLSTGPTCHHLVDAEAIARERIPRQRPGPSVIVQYSRRTLPVDRKEMLLIG